jgi:hypothetical protein
VGLCTLCHWLLFGVAVDKMAIHALNQVIPTVISYISVIFFGPNLPGILWETLKWSTWEDFLMETDWIPPEVYSPTAAAFLYILVKELALKACNALLAKTHKKIIADQAYEAYLKLCSIENVRPLTVDCRTVLAALYSTILPVNPVACSVPSAPL